MTKLLLVGCGKMGSALLSGWLDQGLSCQDVIVVDPLALPVAPLAGVALYPDLSAVPKAFQPEVVVLAVKPQSMETVVPAYSVYGKAVFLSIAAGKPLAFFQQHLGSDAAVVRAMPNTPAAVRQGMTVAVANGNSSVQQRLICSQLLSAVGEVAWVEDEALMDPVTAVSGSGPAYVFLMVEELAKAGLAAGLPAALAEQLARKTVTGAGELLRQSTEAPSVLRQNVTSPGGTTFAALQVLMAENGLGPLLCRAVAAASQRSQELAAPGQGPKNGK